MSAFKLKKPARTPALPVAALPVRHRRTVAAAALLVLFVLAVWPGAGRLCSTGLSLAARLAPVLDCAPYLAVARSGEVQDRRGTLLYAFTGKNEQWCFPRTLDQISPRLVNATLAAPKTYPQLPAIWIPASFYWLGATDQPRAWPGPPPRRPGNAITLSLSGAFSASVL